MPQRHTDAAPERRFVLIGQAADILRVSVDTVRRQSDSGEIPCIRFGSRGQRRYDPDVLREMARSAGREVVRSAS